MLLSGIDVSMVNNCICYHAQRSETRSINGYPSNYFDVNEVFEPRDEACVCCDKVLVVEVLVQEGKNCWHVGDAISGVASLFNDYHSVLIVLAEVTKNLEVV